MNWNDFDNINNSFSKSISKQSDNITEVKDDSVIIENKDNLNENNIEDISIQILEGKKKSTDNLNNNTSIRNESNIKFPSENENILSNNRILSNSFTVDDNLYKNIKV